MSHLKIHNQEYLSGSEAADVVGCTVDHIARLARSGKFTAKKISGNWFIESRAFYDYVLGNSYNDALKKAELSTRRKSEYAKAVSSKTLRGGPSAVEAMLMMVDQSIHRRGKVLHSFVQQPLYVVTPFAEFLHKVFAFITSLLLVFGSYSFFDTSFSSFTRTSVIEGAHTAKKIILAFATQPIMHITEASAAAVASIYKPSAVADITKNTEAMVFSVLAALKDSPHTQERLKALHVPVNGTHESEQICLGDRSKDPVCVERNDLVRLIENFKEAVKEKNP